MTTENETFGTTAYQTVSEGESAAIRLANANSESDTTLIKSMDEDPQIISEFVSHPENYFMSHAGLFSSALTDEKYLGFAVSGAKGKVEKDEEFKLQGIVLLNPDEDHRKNQLVEKQVIKENTEVYEISYAKRQQAASGQMASGLRQALTKLVAMKADVAEDNSETTGRPNFAVVAYVMDKEPFNAASQNVLLACGFEETSPDQRVWYDEEPGDRAPKQDRVFVLNWGRFMEITAKKTGQPFAVAGAEVR